MAKLEAARASGFICAMTEETMKVAIDQFMKNVTFTAQRELEKAVRTAFTSGRLQGGEVLTLGVTLSNEKVGLDVSIFRKIEL
jgi:Family of unknown function (DUF6494)